MKNPFYKINFFLWKNICTLVSLAEIMNKPSLPTLSNEIMDFANKIKPCAYFERHFLDCFKHLFTINLDHQMPMTVCMSKVKSFQNSQSSITNDLHLPMIFEKISIHLSLLSLIKLLHQTLSLI